MRFNDGLYDWRNDIRRTANIREAKRKRIARYGLFVAILLIVTFVVSLSCSERQPTATDPSIMAVEKASAYADMILPIQILGDNVKVYDKSGQLLTNVIEHEIDTVIVHTANSIGIQIDGSVCFQIIIQPGLETNNID